MRRVYVSWLVGAAFLAALGAASADEAGVPAAAVANAASPLALANSAAPVIDFASTGALKGDGSRIEPELPPDVQPAVGTPPFDRAEPSPPSLPTVAQRLPAALDALIARGGPNPLGAGDWRAAREAVRAFYAARAFQPAWTDVAGLNAAGRAAVQRLARAGKDALDLSTFPLPAADLRETSPDKLAAVETTLSAAVVVYATQASGVRIAPAAISPDVTAHPDVVDPGEALSEVAAAADPGAQLLAFNPPQEGYQRLRDKLSLLPPPPQGAPTAAKPPRVVDADPRIPLIRVRASLSGAESSAPPSGRLAAGALTDARAMLVSASEEKQRDAIEANMEMWRWEPREMGRDRIEINVPDFMLRLIKDGAEADRTRVIVGKPDTPTPIFSNAVKYLLVNPIWRVPYSIVKKEMLPRAAGDPGYFTRHGYVVKYIGGQMFVEQPPGEANALGHILFLFPNEHAVYLHDTPARSLFAAGRRAFSHGCIRVEQPMRLAEDLMGGPANGWPARRIEGLLGSTERYLAVPTPLPIHIEYFTEFVDDDGALRERDDIYGLTARVASTLARLRQD